MDLGVGFIGLYSHLYHLMGLWTNFLTYLIIHSSVKWVWLGRLYNAFRIFILYLADSGSNNC